MKVRRNSWHFRLYVRLRSVYEREPIVGSNKYFGWLLFPVTMVRFLKPIPADTEELVVAMAPRSLCTYFWTNVGLTVGTLILWPLSVVLVIVLVAPYALLLGVGLFVATGWQAIKLLFKTHKQAKWARAAAKGLPEPTPSVLLEFVKAKKRRVCPILHYTD